VKKVVYGTSLLDVPGNHPFATARRVLEPSGRYVLIGHDQYGTDHRWLGSIPRAVKLMALSRIEPQLAGMRYVSPSRREGMAELTELLTSGDLEPVVDRTYPLAAVPEAIRYLESGAVQGKVVVTVDR
jgi:NADPH:quinone reductase-like Zn-dependent oxidoreductase